MTRSVRFWRWLRFGTLARRDASSVHKIGDQLQSSPTRRLCAVDVVVHRNQCNDGVVGENNGLKGGFYLLQHAEMRGRQEGGKVRVNTYRLLWVLLDRLTYPRSRTKEYGV